MKSHHFHCPPTLVNPSHSLGFCLVLYWSESFVLTATWPLTLSLWLFPERRTVKYNLWLDSTVPSTARGHLKTARRWDRQTDKHYWQTTETHRDRGRGCVKEKERERKRGEDIQTEKLETLVRETGPGVMLKRTREGQWQRETQRETEREGWGGTNAPSNFIKRQTDRQTDRGWERRGRTQMHTNHFHK